MKQFKRIAAWVMTLAMALTLVMGGLISAKAEGEAAELKTELSGDNVIVTLVAKKSFVMGGIEVQMGYDEEAFSYVSCVSDKLGVTVAGKKISADAASASFSSGDVLLTLTFAKTDAFEKGQNYEFSLTVYGAGFYNYDESEDLGQVGDKYADTYMEEAEPDPSDPPETDPPAPTTYNVSDIVITKKITGIDYDAITFTFVVTPNDGAPAIGNATIDVPAYVEGADTEYTVNLADVTYTAAGTYTYTITEQNDGAADWTYDDTSYILTVFVQKIGTGDNDFGITSIFVKKTGEEEKCEIEFTNTYNCTTTKLTVQNENVTPLVPEDKEFTYTITFSAPTGDGSKAPQYVTDPDGNRLDFGTAYEFKLDDGKSAEFTDIPVGTTFTLVETGVAAHKHTVIESNVTEIAVDTTVNGPTNLELAGTLPGDEADGYKVTVENERVYEVAPLTVSKVVEGNPPYAETFSFTITFTAVDGLETILPKVTVNGSETEVAYGTAYSFTLQGGDSIEFTNIPVGVTYVLTETGTENYVPSYEASSGATGNATVGATLTTSSIEIVPETNTITVTNTYDVTVPTGITIRYEMIGIVALVLVAIAGSIVISKKFRKARD